MDPRRLFPAPRPQSGSRINAGYLGKTVGSKPIIWLMGFPRAARRHPAAGPSPPARRCPRRPSAPAPRRPWRTGGEASRVPRASRASLFRLEGRVESAPGFASCENSSGGRGRGGEGARAVDTHSPGRCPDYTGRKGCFDSTASVFLPRWLVFFFFFLLSIATLPWPVSSADAP